MDVHFNNASIDFVIEYLESATDYTFVYNDTDKEGVKITVSLKDADIVTIERNPVMIEPAKKNLREFGAEDKIKMLIGDAVELLPTLDGTFDLIFIDAAKGQYPVFLREAERLLVDEGVIVADNVLFNGMVATGIPDIRRNKTIVKRLAEFLRELEADISLKTVILPISDGVTVSVRTGTKER